MSNDFIPFAVGGSANVTPQATYAANTTLTQNGFQSGIAKSPDLNKVWRQSSIMSAVLAQFIVNQSGQNAVDDGTTTTLLANLLAAVQATSRAAASGVVGQVRNLLSVVTTASTTKTVTADEVIVETALGGVRYCLSGINLTGNIATQMDTGSAPASGFVAEYLIYNPNASLSGTNPRLLYTNATSAVQPNVYGGANMPAGYTASALLTVVPTNASSQIVPCIVQDRSVDIANVTTLSTNTVAASPTIVNNLAVPLNAKNFSGTISAGNTSASTVTLTLYSSAASTSPQNVGIALTVPGSNSAPLTRLKLSTAQRMFYTATSTTGTPTFTVVANSYEI